jgi:hypothetical protein
MKNLVSSALRRKRNFFSSSLTSDHGVLFFSIVLFIGFLMTGCQKENLNTTGQEEIQSRSNQSATTESNGFGNYKGLAPETIWELQQAKIATAKYNNFDNAIHDGYVDINVIVPEMGYHFLKMKNLDATFEFDKPEILVYNKEENGRMKLLALEYAVPIALSPNGPPAGFTGNGDEWAVYQGTLWTLHAWVWEFNPAGVFNPTNPLVHVD